MKRLLGLLVFAASIGGFYLFLGWMAEGKQAFLDFEKLQETAAAFPIGKKGYPIDILLGMGSLLFFLAGLKWLLSRSPPAPPAPPDDPSDEKSVRRYKILLASYKPSPRMPGVLVLNSFVLATLVLLLFFGSRQPPEFMLEGQKLAFWMGLWGATLGLAVLTGLVMFVLAAKKEKSLGSFRGLFSILIHLGAVGAVVLAVVLTAVKK